MVDMYITMLQAHQYCLYLTQNKIGSLFHSLSLNVFSELAPKSLWCHVSSVNLQVWQKDALFI